MDRLQAMEMFVRVVETGSFSKAAKDFQVTQPTVTKQMAATEARLKARLLNRNTRGVSTRRPKATEVPTRSSPCACDWRIFTTLSASSTSRTMFLHFS